MCCSVLFYLPQDPNAEVTIGKNLLARYFFENNNAQTISTCVRVKEEITPYVEQFKTDGI